jgi:hypothetical protein
MVIETHIHSNKQPLVPYHPDSYGLTLVRFIGRNWYTAPVESESGKDIVKVHIQGEGAE